MVHKFQKKIRKELNYTEWINPKKLEQVVAQKTKGEGWYVYHVQAGRKGLVKTIFFDKNRTKAENFAKNWIKNNW